MSPTQFTYIHELCIVRLFSNLPNLTCQQYQHQDSRVPTKTIEKRHPNHSLETRPFVYLNAWSSSLESRPLVNYARPHIVMNIVIGHINPITWLCNCGFPGSFPGGFALSAAL